MKVPLRLVRHLARAMGLSYHTVHNWSKYDVPESREREVEQAMADLPEHPSRLMVPPWLVAPLHRTMGFSRTTVSNWAKYGVPKLREQEVKEAMAAMERENKQGAWERGEGVKPAKDSVSDLPLFKERE